MIPRHVCTCCGRRYTAAEWDRLPLAGRWLDLDLEINIETRLCLCGSHRSVEL